jgi:hypothetical protein
MSRLRVKLDTEELEVEVGLSLEVYYLGSIVSWASL